MTTIKLNQIVKTPEATGIVMNISNYLDNKETIDNNISEQGWESGTSRDELKWYLVDCEAFGPTWYDEDELKAYNN